MRYINEASSRTGLYGAYLAVDAKATGTALDLMLHQYDTQPAGWFDIEKVVVLSNEGMPFFTIAGRAHHVAQLFVRGHDLDYFTKLRQRLDDERGNQLSGLVFDYLRSDRMHVVLVGDPDIIRSQVPPLGKGQLVELQFASE